MSDVWPQYQSLNFETEYRIWDKELRERRWSLYILSKLEIIQPSHPGNHCLIWEAQIGHLTSAALLHQSEQRSLPQEVVLGCPCSTDLDILPTTYTHTQFLQRSKKCEIWFSTLRRAGLTVLRHYVCT